MCGGAETAVKAVGAGHGDGRHAGKENKRGFLLADRFDGFMYGADRERDRVDSGDGEDLGEHSRDKGVGAVSNGNDNYRGRGDKVAR